ncbi:hypothetical protein [Polaromonas sp. UC242_47]|uniref:hypothetical protein n=1 Tax=Polaromonas sp. UC242_47 TaxID=3374626 RepID=UPI0037ACA24A
MAKKPSTAVTEANPRTVRAFDFSPADAEAAQQMGIVVGGPAADRITRAVVSYNMAARLAVESGYLLLSVKGELEHGDFTAALEETGLSSQRASELMRMAKFATSLPDAQRADMLSMPKSKVLMLASADPAVIEDLLSDEEAGDLDALSVRELRQRISDLKAQATDLSVQVETAEAERDGALKKLKKRNQRDEDDQGVPLVIADIRAEMASLVKKAELAVTSMYPVGVEAVTLSGHAEASEWVKPTLRLGLSGLMAVRELIDGSIKSYVEAMGEQAERLASKPDALAFLDESEIKGVAEDWTQLTALHSHEEALRKHERDQAKPKGKGRPAKAPEAPGSKK